MYLVRVVLNLSRKEKTLKLIYTIYMPYLSILTFYIYISENYGVTKV